MRLLRGRFSKKIVQDPLTFRSNPDPGEWIGDN